MSNGSSSNGQAMTAPQPQTRQLSVAEQKVKTFGQFFEARKSALTSIMPKVLSPERVMKVAMAAYSRTPKLWDCTPQSVYEAIHQSVQLGLEPGSPLGHAYLVPYGNACTLIVGYKGLIALARRSGEIASIESHIVMDGDTFDLSYGTESKLIHVPNMEIDRSDKALARFVYGMATLRDGTKQWEVMTIKEVEKIRARSRASSNGPWVTDYLEMVRKTVVRRLCKYLPMSVEMADAVDHEDRQDAAFDMSAIAAMATVEDHDPVTGEVVPAALPEPVVIAAPAQAQTASEKTILAAKRANKAKLEVAAEPVVEPAPAAELDDTTAVDKVVNLAKTAQNAADVRAAQSVMDGFAREGALSFDGRSKCESAIAAAQGRLGM